MSSGEDKLYNSHPGSTRSWLQSSRTSTERRTNQFCDHHRRREQRDRLANTHREIPGNSAGSPMAADLQHRERSPRRSCPTEGPPPSARRRNEAAQE
eukprot:7968970-Heterocapsa_arctica.AAC.1